MKRSKTKVLSAKDEEIFQAFLQELDEKETIIKYYCTLQHMEKLELITIEEVGIKWTKKFYELTDKYEKEIHQALYPLDGLIEEE